MNKFFIVILLAFPLSKIVCQDNIIRTDGRNIDCKITAVDSIQIFFLYKTKGTTTNTHVLLTEVSSYKWNGQPTFIQKTGTGKTYIPDATSIYADSIEGLNRNFVYLYSENILFGNIIETHKPFFGILKIYVDNNEIDANKVKFYSNETGFYANIQDLKPFHSSIFAERELSGKINLYESIHYVYIPGGYQNGYNKLGFSLKKINIYYNKGFDDLKKANYKNLCNELSGNSISLKHLKKYQNLSNVRTFLLIAGTASIIGSIISTNSKMDKNDSANLATESILALSGIAGFGVSYLITLKRPIHLWNAIYEYNRY